MAIFSTIFCLVFLIILLTLCFYLGVVLWYMLDGEDKPALQKNWLMLCFSVATCTTTLGIVVYGIFSLLAFLLSTIGMLGVISICVGIFGIIAFLVVSWLNKF